MIKSKKGEEVVPLANMTFEVRVSAFNDSLMLQGKADEQGKFDIKLPLMLMPEANNVRVLPYNVKIRFSMANYTSIEYFLSVGSYSTLPEQDLGVFLAKPALVANTTVNITGAVYDSMDNSPIQQAKISLSLLNSIETLSSQTGHF
jgi:hypothetical protein